MLTFYFLWTVFLNFVCVFLCAFVCLCVLVCAFACLCVLLCLVVSFVVQCRSCRIILDCMVLYEKY